MYNVGIYVCNASILLDPMVFRDRGKRTEFTESTSGNGINVLLFNVG